MLRLMFSPPSETTLWAAADLSSITTLDCERNTCVIGTASSPVLRAHFGTVPPKNSSGKYRWKSSFRQSLTASCWGKRLCIGFGEQVAARRECRWSEHVSRITCSRIARHWNKVAIRRGRKKFSLTAVLSLGLLQVDQVGERFVATRLSMLHALFLLPGSSHHKGQWQAEVEFSHCETNCFATMTLVLVCFL